METRIQFIELMKKLKNGIHVCKFDKRPKKFLFGTNNYGEIIGYINPADGDRWDIIAPGYEILKRNSPFIIKKIEGIILMPNLNHKIIVNIYTNQKRDSFYKRKKEILNYRDEYAKYTKIEGEVIL